MSTTRRKDHVRSPTTLPSYFRGINVVSTRLVQGRLVVISIVITILTTLSQNNLFAQAATTAPQPTKPTLSRQASSTSITTTMTPRHDLSFLDDLRRKYPHQPTFLQAVEEMALSLKDIFEDPDQGEFYQRAFLMMAEPERILAFRVPWMDDQGNLQYNRAWRVEFSRYDSMV